MTLQKFQKEINITISADGKTIEAEWWSPEVERLLDGSPIEEFPKTEQELTDLLYEITLNPDRKKWVTTGNGLCG